MNNLNRHIKLVVMLFSLFLILMISGCGGGGGGSGGSTSGGNSGGSNWYYHFSCNGDSECLSTNFLGQPSGTSESLGPVYANCSALLTFAAINWNMPPATNSCDNSPETPPATLVTITVTPANKTLPIGATQQYTAIGFYSDGVSKDITALVTWSVDFVPVICDHDCVAATATISATGLATAGAVGMVQVDAKLGAIAGSTKLYVSAAALISIVITPADSTINQYDVQQFTVLGNYSDGSTKTLTSASVAWSSSLPLVATISSPGGLATGVTAGTTTITATFGAISGSTTLTILAVWPISITVTPANPSIPKGTTQAFVATGHYADGSNRDISNEAVWASDTPAVTTIDSSGLATGLTVGVSIVSAEFGGVSGSTTFNVIPAALSAISVSPVNPNLAQGFTKQFTATGTFSDMTLRDITLEVNWSSATTDTASIDSSGLSTGIAAGTSIISATKDSIFGTTNLSVVTPGTTWVQVASGTSTHLMSVTWSGTQFVAVGESGVILTSPDGNVWTARISGTSNTLNAVIKAGSQLVAVGAGGTILTSSDGVTWVVRSSGTSVTLNAATWTGSTIFVVGYSMVTLSSSDGIVWANVPTTSPYYSPDVIFTCIAWSGSTFVEGMAGGGSALFVSPDATTFTVQSFNMQFGALWAGDRFVLVTVNGIISVSADANSWTFPTTGTSSTLKGVAWSGTQFAVVGNTGTILTSPDAAVWTLRTSGTTQNLKGVAWSGANFVAVGDQGTILITSP